MCGYHPYSFAHPKGLSRTQRPKTLSTPCTGPSGPETRTLPNLFVPQFESPCVSVTVFIGKGAHLFVGISFESRHELVSFHDICRTYFSADSGTCGESLVQLFERSTCRLIESCESCTPSSRSRFETATRGFRKPHSNTIYQQVKPTSRVVHGRTSRQV